MGRQVENLQINFFLNQEKNHKNYQQKFWKSIASVFPGKKESQTQIWLKDTQGDVEILHIPNYMNAFFTEIGPKLARDHTERWDYYGETVINDIPPFHLGNRSWCGHPKLYLMPG